MQQGSEKFLEVLEVKLAKVPETKVVDNFQVYNFYFWIL
jgi:hypothetical protein